MKGKSKERAKNMEKTLNFIQEVLTELQSKPSIANKEVRLEDFMMQHLLSLSGIDQIASRYLEGWYVSIKQHQMYDDRILLIARFLGLDEKGMNLPHSMFTYYIRMIKDLNIDLRVIFSRNQRESVKITYIKVLQVLKK